MTEHWAVSRSFPNYEVSVDGAVRSIKTGVELRPTQNQYGNLKVNLTQAGEQFTKSVSHLVAAQHLDPPPREDFNTLIHLDGDRSNCKVENLLWRPRHFAIKYHEQFNTVHFKKNHTVVRELKTEEVMRIQDAATSFGILLLDIVIAINMNTYVWPTYQKFSRITE